MGGVADWLLVVALTPVATCFSVWGLKFGVWGCWCMAYSLWFVLTKPTLNLSVLNKLTLNLRLSQLN